MVDVDTYIGKYGNFFLFRWEKLGCPPLYNKDIKLFSKDLVDIVLQTGWYVGQPKMHNLILEVTISSAKDRFLFIAFSNSHSMISTS